MRVNEQVNDLVFHMNYRGAALITYVKYGTTVAAVQHALKGRKSEDVRLNTAAVDRAIALKYIRPVMVLSDTVRHELTPAGRACAEGVVLSRLESKVFQYARKHGVFNAHQVERLNRVAMRANVFAIYEIADNGRSLIMKGAL